MHIARHALDNEYLADMPHRAERTFARLPRLTEAARRDPSALGILADVAHTAAAFLHLVDPLAPTISEALRLAAQAGHAIFATARRSVEAVTVELGGGMVTYSSAPNESYVHIGKWFDAF